MSATFIRDKTGGWVNAAHIINVDEQGLAMLTNGRLINISDGWHTLVSDVMDISGGNTYLADIATALDDIRYTIDAIPEKMQ